MFKIPKVEKESFYIDQAMKSMHEIAQKERDNIQQRFDKNASSNKKTREEVNLNKRKDLELAKIRYLNDTLNRMLRKLLKRFPDFRKVDDIYIKLINTNEIGVDEIKDSLSRILWIANTVDEFTQNTEYKIKKSKSQETVGFLMKKYLGKINSLFSKNKKAFAELENARKFMNSLPKFEDLYTVSIAGFPNVGKSTLMKNMSGSNVEIQNYPFTTKGLMFSYLYYKGTKAIQLIDTPGLLNRGDKANAIEERAQIVLNEYCQKIVFVLDFTESCGYTIDKQLKLLKDISKHKKSIIVYLSKTDIYDEEIEEYKDQNMKKFEKYEIFTDYEKLKEDLISSYVNEGKTKFDPTKLKVLK